MLRNIATNLCSRLSKTKQIGPLQSNSIQSLILANQPNYIVNHRSISTSPILFYKTVKRRKRYPFFWLQDQYRAYYDEQLTPQNEEFFQEFLKNKYSLKIGQSPLKTEPWNSEDTYREGLARTGLLGIKLGQYAMWTKLGQKLVTTCILVSDNHVVKYHSPEEFARLGRSVDVKRYQGLGCIVVGADSKDPRQFTAEYNGLFEEGGVMPKKKLTRFFIDHESRLEPGTPLLASHFRPGMFVDIYGKTIDWGNQGVRFRYRLKLGPKSHGCTKAHNRIGSIGRGRRECGPKKGRRMQGRHGGERRIVPGLKVWRVNTKYNLIFVQGPSVPGENGSYVNIMDSRMPKKTLTEINPPPFPTTTLEENSQLATELYDIDLHVPSEPSIIIEITEEEKKAAALAARRMGKAKTAQKVR